MVKGQRAAPNTISRWGGGQRRWIVSQNRLITSAAATGTPQDSRTRVCTINWVTLLPCWLHGFLAWWSVTAWACCWCYNVRHVGHTVDATSTRLWKQTGSLPPSMIPRLFTMPSESQLFGSVCQQQSGLTVSLHVLGSRLFEISATLRNIMRVQRKWTRVKCQTKSWNFIISSRNDEFLLCNDLKGSMSVIKKQSNLTDGRPLLSWILRQQRPTICYCSRSF